MASRYSSQSQPQRTEIQLRQTPHCPGCCYESSGLSPIKVGGLRTHERRKTFPWGKPIKAGFQTLVDLISWNEETMVISFQTTQMGSSVNLRSRQFPSSLPSFNGKVPRTTYMPNYLVTHYASFTYECRILLRIEVLLLPQRLLTRLVNICPPSTKIVLAQEGPGGACASQCKESVERNCRCT